MGAITTALISIGTAVGVGGGGFAAGATGAAIVGTSAYGVRAAIGTLTSAKRLGITSTTGGSAKEDLAAAQEAASVKAQLAQREKQRAISRSRTIYSSPLGVQQQADTAAKTLLGE